MIALLLLRSLRSDQRGGDVRERHVSLSSVALPLSAPRSISATEASAPRLAALALAASRARRSSPSPLGSIETVRRRPVRLMSKQKNR